MVRGIVSSCEGSENEQAIDIKLRDLTGIITLDPGYKNSGSCTSKITFLDGVRDFLRYRGYSIEDLADKADFLECPSFFSLRRITNCSSVETI
jgi:citrate synthase